MSGGGWSGGRVGPCEEGKYTVDKSFFLRVCFLERAGGRATSDFGELHGRLYSKYRAAVQVPQIIHPEFPRERHGCYLRPSEFSVASNIHRFI